MQQNCVQKSWIAHVTSSGEKKQSMKRRHLNIISQLQVRFKIDPKRPLVKFNFEHTSVLKYSEVLHEILGFSDKCEMYFANFVGLSTLNVE